MALSLRQTMRSLVINTLLVRERWQSGVTYNPLSAHMTQNPYPTYAKLRAQDPVHRSILMNSWVFTRYADVDTILRDPRHFANDPRKRTSSGRRRASAPSPEDLSMLFLDPPDHTRLRSLVSKAFTPQTINALEPHIRSLMGTLLDDIDDPAGFDLMEAVANPLPVIVIAEMLGVPLEDRAQFKIWSNQRARIIEPTISAQERQIAEAAARSLDAYFLNIIKARRVEPQNDLISALVHAEEEGDTLTEREMLSMLRLLLVAGNETTTNLIGNGMLALLRHPEQLQALRDDPSLIPAAVEELVRFDAPVQSDFRAAVEDCEVGGFPVQRGQNIVLLIGAANHDPAVFHQPERLDINRRDSNNISFGRGVHHCLGASLARLESRIAFEVLLERFTTSMRLLTDRPPFRNSVVLRGLQHLPVRATLKSVTRRTQASSVTTVAPEA